MHLCMDWRTVKFDWNRARAFLVTAEEGSLSAAARALKMAQPTLGRQVSALEDELGVVLFERVGRALTLTPSGLELVEHVRAMGEAATRLSLAASGQSEAVTGRVCISASEAFSVYVLPPILARLRTEHPGISIDIVASNELSDLRRREADIAVRNGQPSDPDLIGRKIRDETAHLYATPDYLAGLGDLSEPDNLASARFIGFDNNDPFVDGMIAHGIGVTPKQFVVLASSHLVHWELVKQGLGIGVMSAQIGDAETAVERALPGQKPFVFPVWLVEHREVNTSRRVRLVFDFLADALAAM